MRLRRNRALPWRSMKAIQTFRGVTMRWPQTHRWSVTADQPGQRGKRALSPRGAALRQQCGQL
jgi:hypothetical protein